MMVRPTSPLTFAELWKNSAPEEMPPPKRSMENLAWRVLHSLGQLTLHAASFEVSDRTWMALSPMMHPSGAAALALIPHISTNYYLFSGGQKEQALFAKILVAELFHIVKLAGFLLRTPFPTPFLLLFGSRLPLSCQLSLSAIEFTLSFVVGAEYGRLLSFSSDEPPDLWETHTVRTLDCLARLGERDEEWPPFLEGVQQSKKGCEEAARAIIFACALYFLPLSYLAKSRGGRRTLQQCTQLTVKLRKMSEGKFVKILRRLRDDQERKSLLKQIHNLSEEILSNCPAYDKGIAAWKRLHLPPRPSLCQRITHVLQKAARDLGNFLYDLNRRYSYPL